jgi:hypothetical protein
MKGELEQMLEGLDTMGIIRWILTTRETAKIHNKYLADSLCLVSRGEAVLLDSDSEHTTLGRIAA